MTLRRISRFAALSVLAFVSTAGFATASSLSSAAESGGNGTCGRRSTAPRRYRSVVVFAFENRTWDGVGGVGFGAEMPYLRDLAAKCAHFAQWDEADAGQSSLSQYVAQITGAQQPTTVDGCDPSDTCSTKADSIFGQLGRAGRQAVNYVEGPSAPCSADGNAVRHVPALYLWSEADRARCASQVRPLADFDPLRPPPFAFITPTLCNDGHDCDNATVDRWAQAHVQPVLNSAAYRAGKVAVFIWYDEDRPVPNIWITPTAKPGPVTVVGAGYTGTLRAWQSMLGLPCLANACTAPNMRAAAHA